MKQHKLFIMDDKAQIVELQSIFHPSGTITVAENGRDFPFSVQRAYFLHRLAEDSKRGSHGHVKLRQLMIAVSGSFRVSITSVHGTEVFRLSEPTQGLLIPPMTWRDLDEFTSSAICMVLASDRYDEADYIRNYSDFLDHLKLQS
ncbi:FdtA/QdtA family cupin domain-containing protein [Pontimonas sp.]|nr:FdtA/QdtA family cupin domain-containing protein [Pontimonas sp.]